MTPLLRRAVAELVGTAFLVMAVIGSGIMATRLTDDVGLQLLANSVATGAALVALILALHPVSSAFNPVVTLVEAALGQLPAGEVLALIGSQMVGGVVGADAGQPDVRPARDLDRDHRPRRCRPLAGRGRGHPRPGDGRRRDARSGRIETLALGVGGYITAAYWFTSSTSFANPAVTFARTLSDTFTGIDPESAPMFMLMQLVGGALAFGLVRVLHPAPGEVDHE